jgi:hypothetical protein
MTASGSQAVLVDWIGFQFQQSSLELLNLSYGGMCFRANDDVKPGAVNHYLLNIRGVLDEGMVFVKARVEWSKAAESDGYLCGASFIESSKGWLG